MTEPAAPFSDRAVEGPSHRLLPLVAVGVTMVFWASAFVAIRYLADDISPGPLSLARITVAALALTAVALTQPRVRPTRREWLTIGAIGVLWYAVYHIALNAGEHRVDAGTAAMLLQVSPLLIALAAACFLGERFTLPLAAGLVLAFSGVVLISLSDTPGGGPDLWGVVLCLVAAASYVISVILQKPVMRRIPAVQLTWLACVVGAIVQVPFAPALVAEVSAAPVSSSLWLLYLGLFPTALAFTTYGYALTHMSASSLGVTTYLVPPITIVLSWLFLGEAPPALAYVGGALALIGVAVARTPPSRLKDARK